MNRVEAAKFAFEQLKKYNLYDWTFKFNKNKRRLGVCKFIPKRIEVSIYHLTDNEEDVKDTILHEIAHALSPRGEGHGKIWKLNCLRIGAKPNRLADPHLMKNVPCNYKLICNSCGIKIPRQRKPKRTLACTECCKKHNNGRFSTEYAFEISKC